MSGKITVRFIARAFLLLSLVPSVNTCIFNIHRPTRKQNIIPKSLLYDTKHDVIRQEE